MQIVMILLADYAAADASNKLNILGAFTHLNSYQFPVRHPLMHLVMKIQPAPSEYGDTRTLRIVLVDEDGNELFQMSGDINIPRVKKGGELPELNAIIAFRDLEFPRAGTYEFRVLIDKDQKAELPLKVAQIQQPQPEE